MSWLKHRITVRGRDNRSPFGHGPAIVEEGQTAFNSYCIVCHGLDGQNTGVPFANQISPPIPSLASMPVQLYTDGQLKWIIENGVSPSGMPAARGILSDEEMWSIVEYLRHLPRLEVLASLAYMPAPARIWTISAIPMRRLNYPRRKNEDHGDANTSDR